MKTTKLADILKDMQRREKQIKNAFNSRIPKLVGEMLIEGFQESFDMQRFNDSGSPKWQEVKRRIYGQPWYGFNLKTNDAIPKGSRGKLGLAKRKGKTNFSKRATTRSILLGSGSANLRDSLFLKKARQSIVIIESDQPHAKVHNEGLTAKIFGKRSFKMPKRQFMGTSHGLNKQAELIMERVFSKIL